MAPGRIFLRLGVGAQRVTLSPDLDRAADRDDRVAGVLDREKEGAVARGAMLDQAAGLGPQHLRAGARVEAQAGDQPVGDLDALAASMPRRPGGFEGAVERAAGGAAGEREADAAGGAGGEPEGGRVQAQLAERRAPVGRDRARGRLQPRPGGERDRQRLAARVGDFDGAEAAGAGGVLEDPGRDREAAARARLGHAQAEGQQAGCG